jgi:hypothetical protein
LQKAWGRLTSWGWGFATTKPHSYTAFISAVGTMPPKRNRVPTKLWDESTGAGPVKRSSKGNFDPAALAKKKAKAHGPEKTWQVRGIVSERLQKDKNDNMVPHFRVKWASVATGDDAGPWSDDEYDTHEVLGNLPGMEGMIHAMRAERADVNAAAEAEATTRKEAKRLKLAAARTSTAQSGEDQEGEQPLVDPEHLITGGSKTSKVSV